MDFASVRRNYLPAVPVACCLIGTLLVVSSLLPLESIVSRSNWTETDSDEYQRVTREYKKSAYKSPGELGLTAEQYAKRQENLAIGVHKMKTKLEDARSQGRVWKRTLFWSGLALTGIGLSLRLFQETR